MKRKLSKFITLTLGTITIGTVAMSTYSCGTPRATVDPVKKSIDEAFTSTFELYKLYLSSAKSTDGNLLGKAVRNESFSSTYGSYLSLEKDFATLNAIKKIVGLDITNLSIEELKGTFNFDDLPTDKAIDAVNLSSSKKSNVLSILFGRYDDPSNLNFLNSDSSINKLLKGSLQNISNISSDVNLFTFTQITLVKTLLGSLSELKIKDIIENNKSSVNNLTASEQIKGEFREIYEAFDSDASEQTINTLSNEIDKYLSYARYAYAELQKLVSKMFDATKDAFENISEPQVYSVMNDFVNVVAVTFVSLNKIYKYTK
jgi:hypothetical protein